MPAADWNVLVFGDSWADYMHPCWPQVLAHRMGARYLNFANAGSMCHQLPEQANRAMRTGQAVGPDGKFKAETLVVVHTCGNDFIAKMAEGIMGGGGLGMLFGGPAAGPPMTTPEFLLPNPGRNEIVVLTRFLEQMYQAGARHFLVSGVPIFLEMPIWNMVMPIIGGMINSGKLEALGVSPGDPPRLAVEVQAAALHEMWEQLSLDFGKKYSDSTCIFFDEVAALERLREKLGAHVFDRQMWDFTMFHPSPYGHQQLADEAHRCTVEVIQILSDLAPHPSASTQARAPRSNGYAAAPATAPATAPAATAAATPAPTATAVNGQATVLAGGKMTIQVRNVKGDVVFPIECVALWNAQRLKEEVLLKAPPGFAAPGATCVIAVKGKFLGQGPESLSELGLVDGGQVIAVMKSATPAKTSA
eukprot:TRINITY_DN96724_c0_g1_i1.p1 TRINITY_DN96724_c0_g1~~TRINITY_DN96724_c0_g1_i1.p1  ORF type:complete len:418 (+),score=115.59 TRINITY_DN96724_c0_g1_i1:87-1340(+)